MKKTIEYILKTEDIKIETIRNILAQFGISCYSEFGVVGCWNGKIEMGLAIQIIDTGIDKVNPVIIECIAQEIKDQNHQDCVLVEKRELEYKMV